jgi:signal transduction histidine kinase
MAVEGPALSDIERLRRLQAVTDAALAHLSVDELLSELLDRISSALEADTCAFLLLDPDRNELVARAAKGIEEEVEQGVRIPVGKGFAGRIAAERRTVALDDVDHADVLNPLLRERGIKSLLGAPLIARGRVMGVVHVGTLAPRHFREDEAELLQLVAERAALGLERSLLHEELLNLDAMRQEFVATAAHELRTPASVIYGVAKTIAERRDSLDAKTLAGLVEAFYDASVRLAQLTEDLLDLTRFDSATADLELAPVPLRKLIEELTVSSLPGASEQIELTIPEGLVIMADRAALERILGNVLRNAIVHGEPPISIRATADVGGARISILDRGPGIPEPFARRLFEPFSRSNHSTGKPGVGLGLAIAQSYARRLGGELRYEPGRPKGSVFTLVLPQPDAGKAPAEAV